MPAYTPAAENPAGAVIPPSTAWILVSVRAAALDMQLCRGLDLGYSVEVGHHRELFAPPEERAVAAVGRDFLRQPRVRNNRKAHMREVRRLMSEDTQVVISCGSGPGPKLVDDLTADALSAALLGNDEGPDFRERGT